MDRMLAIQTPELVGQQIKVSGWVNTRRDHGGVIFVDLRDHTGLVQLVFNPDRAEMFRMAEGLRDEFCISAVGTVRERGEGLTNPNIATGSIEIVAEQLEILNRSEPLPVATRDDGQQSGEEMRLKYRFLDLRRPSMQRMIADRAKFYQVIRQYMAEHDFTEVATPILANSSPEGARDFLIPSRLRAGKYYALPQAPQQFKQLLMVGGVPRYYQIAACFRDEDPRSDRLYGEFYQLDCEMSFVDDGETVRRTMDPLMLDLAQNFGHKKIVNTYKSADKDYSADPTDFPRIPYVEAMERYGVDKPDLRYGMELIELTDVFANTEFGVFKSAEAVKALCVKNAADMTRKQIDNFTELAKKEGAGGLAYLTYRDGEVKSPIAKFLTADELSAVAERAGAVDGDIVFFGADKRALVNKVLGKLRIAFADFQGLKHDDEVAMCWITDFPFYEYDEARGKVDFGHNPFSMPKGGLAALENAQTDEQKLAIMADQYDFVMNGYEVCSGAVRNHNPEIMYQVFGLLGYDRDYVDQKFGAMLNAFKFGAPPHAGCAYGLDRIFMVLEETDNIRDIVAFPKNGSGVDLMMNSPSEVFDSQLKELHIQPAKDLD
ncbi:MAG: aspartate--tRNA ligase [Candidatus Saccharibacteria bacterium]|nr:aspartate--tRNA ligase [Candidatus Saccharibacteria bacterium]